MSNVFKFPVKEAGEEKLTLELLKEYTEVILLAHQMKDQLTDIADWRMAFQVATDFNYLLIKHIRENGMGLEMEEKV